MTFDLQARLNNRICAVARREFPRIVLIAAATSRYAPLRVVSVEVQAAVTIFAAVVCVTHALNAVLRSVMLMVRAVITTVSAAVNFLCEMSQIIQLIILIFIVPKASAARSLRGNSASPSSRCLFCNSVVFCAARSAAEM